MEMLFDKYLGSLFWMTILLGPLYYFLEIKIPLKKYPQKRTLREAVSDYSWELLDYLAWLCILPVYRLVSDIYWYGLLPKFTETHPTFEFLRTLKLPELDIQNFVVQFITIFIILDFLKYFIHRYFHRSFFWRFHILHHSVTRMDWVALSRAHFMEGVFAQIILSWAMIFFKVNPIIIACYGAAEVHISFFVHSNIKLKNNFLFSYILNSPLAHHWHHSDENIFRGGQNFGNVLIIWDRLFGTYHIDESGNPPEVYGIKDQTYPTTFFQRLLYPLKIRK